MQISKCSTVGRHTVSSSLASRPAVGQSLPARCVRQGLLSTAGSKQGGRGDAQKVHAVTSMPIFNQPTSSLSLLQPPSTYDKMVALGTEKANLPVGKTVVLALLAGVYVAFGALLMLSAGASCPGIAEANPGLQRLIMGFFGLPFGLLTVLLCGAELFTGNIAFLATAFFEKKISIGQVLKNWIVSYFGNLAGAIFLVKLVALSGVAVAAPSAIAVAGNKTGLPFLQAFIRGILGNWLVCIAVWQATAAASLPGKVLGVVLPISAFVTMGFEHSVANMFLIPFGIASGAGFTFNHFLSSNLIPVTLGNIVGALLVATPYAFAYGKKN